MKNLVFGFSLQVRPKPFAHAAEISYNLENLHIASWSAD